MVNLSTLANEPRVKMLQKNFFEKVLDSRINRCYYNEVVKIVNQFDADTATKKIEKSC
jgi:hypothetical protein